MNILTLCKNFKTKQFGGTQCSQQKALVAQMSELQLFLHKAFHVDLFTYQGHPTDRFGKFMFGRPLIPYNFLKGIFTLNFRDMGNLRPSAFRLINMSFRVPKKGQLRFSERK